MFFSRRLLNGTRKEFVRYLCIGGGGAILDLATLTFLATILSIPAVVAVMINQVIVMVYSFLGMKHWTFKNKAMPHVQMLRYLLLMLGNYILAVVLMYIFHTQLAFQYLPVRMGSMIVTVCWNFILYKYWVFS